MLSRHHLLRIPNAGDCASPCAPAAIDLWPVARDADLECVDEAIALDIEYPRRILICQE